MIVLRRLAQPFLAGIICGTVMLLLLLGLTQVYNLDRYNFGVANYLALILAFPTFIFGIFLFPPGTYVLHYSTLNLLLPSALWFIIAFGARLVTRSSRATLFICIGLFVIYVLFGYLAWLMFSTIG
jgi:hypothetical protein